MGTMVRVWHLRVVLLPVLLLIVLGGAALAADSGTITFSLDFPNSAPEHYSMSVQADGKRQVRIHRQDLAGLG